MQYSINESLSFVNGEKYELAKLALKNRLHVNRSNFTLKKHLAWITVHEYMINKPSFYDTIRIELVKINDEYIGVGVYFVPTLEVYVKPKYRRRGIGKLIATKLYGSINNKEYVTLHRGINNSDKFWNHIFPNMPIEVE